MKVKFHVSEVAACPVTQGLLSYVCGYHDITLPVLCLMLSYEFRIIVHSIVLICFKTYRALQNCHSLYVRA